MRSLFLCLAGLVIGVSCRAQDVVEKLPRNPFWPQGFEDVRYPISAEPRFKPEPPEEAAPDETNAVENVQQSSGAAAAAAEAEKAVDPLKEPIWGDAVKALHFGSTMSYTSTNETKAVVMINGRVYMVGDLVSANFDDSRFTWKIESLTTDGKIHLKRIIYRKLTENKQ